MTGRPAGARGLVAALCAVNLVVAADFLGASVLVAPIGRDLSMTTASLAWIVNGYLLTLAAPLIAFGRLADARGAVRLTRLGLLAFATGAAVSGAAPAAWVLVGGRMLQGLGASVLTATGLSLVSTAAAPDRRGRTIGIWAAVGAVGSASGPLLAGVLALWSWRAFFLVDVPFALAVWWVLARRRDEARPAPVRVDHREVAALTAGLGGLVYALLAGPDRGWGAPDVVVGFVLGGLLLAVFVRLERTVAHPLVDPRTFSMPGWRPAAVTAFVANAAFATVSFFASLYLQQVVGLGAAAAGAAFLAMTVPLIALSPLAGRVADRVGATVPMAVGLAVVGVGVGGFAALGTGGGTGPVVLLLGISGVGQAVAFTVSNLAAMQGPAGEAGLESGVINEIRQIGALLGLAATGAAFGVLQAAAAGGAAARFVDALGPPTLALGAVCIATAVGVALAGRAAPRAPEAGAGSGGR